MGQRRVQNRNSPGDILYHEFNGFLHDGDFQMGYISGHNPAVETDGGMAEFLKLNLLGSPYFYAGMAEKTAGKE